MGGRGAESGLNRLLKVRSHLTSKITAVLKLSKKEVAERWKRGWDGVSPPQPTRGSWECRELPSAVRGGAPAANEFGAFCGR